MSKSWKHRRVYLSRTGVEAVKGKAANKPGRHIREEYLTNSGLNT